jgi:hypothetical protein
MEYSSIERSGLDKAKESRPRLDIEGNKALECMSYW